MNAVLESILNLKYKQNAMCQKQSGYVLRFTGFHFHVDRIISFSFTQIIIPWKTSLKTPKIIQTAANVLEKEYYYHYLMDTACEYCGIINEYPYKY